MILAKTGMILVAWNAGHHEYALGFAASISLSAFLLGARTERHRNELEKGQ
jgi:hypothetical protein